ncbi:hypothetical protein C8R45DRAFT_1130512 [Mycena sanguinolenta]|nr:hypothetical protein C8R45DRAFT_1130512 [Mycena sanguinolenta]
MRSSYRVDRTTSYGLLDGIFGAAVEYGRANDPPHAPYSTATYISIPSSTMSIYVFNKYYLDLPVDDVLRELRVEAVLQPPIEDGIAATPPFRPSQLGALYLRTAHSHKEFISHILTTMHSQHAALRIASTSLDMHVFAVVDTFESVATSSRRELEKQASLLAGLEADLDIISKVRIHTEFVSPAVRKAIESGEKPRTLGDYVSNAKMKQQADSVRSTIMEISLLDDAVASSRRADEIWEKFSHSAGVLEGHVPDPDDVLQELRQHDFALRQELQLIVHVKNDYTAQCINALRSISVLNNDMIQIPPTLANLQSSFRGKNSFAHLVRLHNMLYAYGATVIEIVRRKEFSRFFYQRAQSILEVMAKLSASERKRRQVHRGEVHGQFPFETRGMDDAVPMIDFSPSGNQDASYSLEREDIDGLLRVLDDLENASRDADDLVALAAVRECHTALDKLIVKMDSLESGFDRIAERSLLSASRLSSSRRRCKPPSFSWPPRRTTTTTTTTTTTPSSTDSANDYDDDDGVDAAGAGDFALALSSNVARAVMQAVGLA